MSTFVAHTTAPECPGQEYRFVCGHTAAPDRIAAITSEIVARYPDTTLTVHRTLSDGCRELFVAVHVAADTHADAVARAERLADELLCDTGVETVCWGLHLGGALVACDE